jgi:hypothetical protein
MSKFILFIFAVLSFSLTNCTFTNAKLSEKTKAEYTWNQAAGSAAFPQGYGFPVFVKDEKMFAFHHEGVWNSTDGVNWTKTNLPSVKRHAYEAKYMQFNNAVYAFGQNQGNYVEGIQFSSTIRRTTDFKKWETLAEKSELPNRVFYGLIVFGGKIWLMGGYDGKNYYNDIWNSADGVRWTRIAEQAAWSPRNVGIVEFKDRMWIFGGGVIDGEKTINPNSNKEIWSSADGVTWQAQSAPWSPRGAVAVWIVGDKLFMTGGKYSYMKNGEPVFVYSNDVWAMSKKTK